jgi:uncharacterized protein (DUF2235 family)
MNKKLIVCFDGTGNRFGKYNTNVVKLCEVLDRSAEDQVVYYDPGVGTMGDQHALTKVKKALTRLLGGAIGYGLRQNVAEAYDFLCWHHQPGDEIYLFGFSRGAYTARALASLLHMYGLIPGGSGNLTPYLVGMLADDNKDEAPESGLLSGAKAIPTADRRSRWRTANSFKKIFGRKVQIRFMGVFDTVKSVGWLWNPLKLPYTRSNPSVQCVRHAVSIDERRAFFRTNLLSPAAGQDFKEVWFAGVHSDVGGGYAHRDQGLAQLPFEWMIREARAHGLKVEAAALERVLSDQKYALACVTARMHHSLDWRWISLEFLPKPRPLCYRDDSGNRVWQWPLPINCCRRRSVDSSATLHSSVLRRWSEDPRYRPGNLAHPDSHPIET